MADNDVEDPFVFVDDGETKQDKLVIDKDVLSWPRLCAGPMTEYTQEGLTAASDRMTQHSRWGVCVSHNTCNVQGRNK